MGGAGEVGVGGDVVVSSTGGTLANIERSRPKNKCVMPSRLHGYAGG